LNLTTYNDVPIGLIRFYKTTQSNARPLALDIEAFEWKYYYNEYMYSQFPLRTTSHYVLPVGICGRVHVI